MSLPVLDCVKYETVVPSTGKTIKYRPFLVKEEKVILIAQQEDSIKTALQAVKDIIDNCTFNALDIDSLKTYDIEYIFLQIRMKSKGEIVPMAFSCQKEKENGDPCNNIINIDLDLKEAKVIGNKDLEARTVMLDEDKKIGLVMLAPDFSLIESLQEYATSKDSDVLYELVPKFVECVFQSETIYEFTDEEFAQWLESMSPEQFSKITEYFENLPKLSLTHKICCDQCKHEEDVTLQGLKSFLT